MKISILFIVLLNVTLLSSCKTESQRELELNKKEQELAEKESELAGMEHPINHVQTEEELRFELLDKECSRSNELLSGQLKITPVFKNLLSTKVNGIKLRCSVASVATLATFKNIKARVDLKSRTGEVIYSQVFTIYDYVAPGGKINYTGEFSITNQQYSDYNSKSWTILDAECN